MINNISSVLIEKALQKDSFFPQELYNALKMIPEDKESRLSEKVNYLVEQTKLNIAESTTNFRDFRFQHVLVKNFRQYGVCNVKDYFGIKTSNTTPKDDQPCSLILLGDNGAGKSSIFNAIEYWATRNISEAEYRDIENQEWYYWHDEKPADIQIITAEEKMIGLNSKEIWQSSYNVNRFFISENSILESASYMNENGEKGHNWYRFFCYMLGIHPFLIELAFDNEEDNIYNLIQKSLSGLKSETKDFTELDTELKNIHNQIIDASIVLNDEEINSLRKKQDKLREYLTEWENSLNYSNFEKELESVDLSSFNYVPAIHSFNLSCNDIKDRFNKLSAADEKYSKFILQKESTVDTTNIEQLKNSLLNTVSVCLQRLDTTINKNIRYDEIIQRKNQLTQIKKLKGKIDTVQLEILLIRLHSFRTSLADAIQNFLKDFIDTDFKQAIDFVFDRTFINEREYFYFNIENIDDNIINIDVNGIPVHKYFNTFRYRLFCLTMQVVVNLKIMKKYNFSFPIIFDDIFYANDYKNKQQLYKFFECLMKTSSSFLHSKYKLQIIFLTHDEQLVASLHKKFKGSYKFGRMIDIAEFEDEAIQKDLIITPNTEFKYLNLYFPIYEPRKK